MTTEAAKASITESRPKPTRAIELAAMPAATATTASIAFQPIVRYSNRRPRRLSSAVFAVMSPAFATSRARCRVRRRSARPPIPSNRRPLGCIGLGHASRCTLGRLGWRSVPPPPPAAIILRLLSLFELAARLLCPPGGSPPHHLGLLHRFLLRDGALAGSPTVPSSAHRTRPVPPHLESGVGSTRV